MGIETVILDLPTIRTHKLSVATMNGQVLMLVRVHCSDGITGTGEGTTIGGLAYAGESPESMKTNTDTWFAPVMIGQDATRAHLGRDRPRHRRGRADAGPAPPPHL